MIRTPAAIYAILCGVLWLLPLFRLLHVESSAVIAFFSFFIAGISAVQLYKRKETVLTVLGKQLALLLIPLLMLTLSLFWQPNCEYVQGLLFFLLFPCITVIFAVSLAFAIHRSGLKYPTLGLIGIGLFIALAGPIYDVGFHSQFFTYNHVFGGVMGPIYDEEITIRTGLVVFRFLSLLWASLFVLVGLSLQKKAPVNVPGPGRRTRLTLVAIAVLLIGSVYVFSAPLKINSPTWYIEQELGGHLATEHFDIYYDPATTSPFQLYHYEHEHEYRYAYYEEKLGIGVQKRIKSFIYPDPYTKEELTGARFTSVAPVWLNTPQMHVYSDVFDRVFAHELVHVFSREFGLPIINASLSVGLVEGLAVALEPSEGRPFPHEQVITAALASEQVGRLSDSNIRLRVEGSLSPLGFWSGRGAVSYTTMGSFVQFLIDHYGIERIKDVYAFSNFEEVYGKSPEQLTLEWEAYLEELPVVSRVTHDYVTRRFAVPSLFEQRCPHHIPYALKKHRESVRLLAESDTTSALLALEAALRDEPMYQPAVETWGQVHLGMGLPDSVVARVDRLFSGESEQFRTPLLWLWYGDAHALLDNQDMAIEAYEQARERLPLYAHDQVGFVEIRKAISAYPDLLSIIISQGSFDEKIALLRSADIEKNLQRFVEAILLDNAERKDEALTVLESLDITAIPVGAANMERIARYYSIKKTQVYFQTGAISEALTEALNLEKELIGIGAVPEAAFYTDFANKMRYINRAR